MGEKYRRSGYRDPRLHESLEQIKKEDSVCNVERNIQSVVTGWIESAEKIIQIEREESELPQMKRIKKIRPTRWVCDVTVTTDELVVKMKRIIQRRSEQQQPRQNQYSRNF